LHFAKKCAGTRDQIGERSKSCTVGWGGVKLVHDCNRRAAPVSEKEGDIKGGVGGQASVGNGLGGAGDGIIGI
jgi:hypothetical protein